MEIYNGELYVGGNFIEMGGDTFDCCIVKWNGNQWSEVSPIASNGSIHAMTTYKNELYVGGLTISNIGGISVANIARWDSSLWKGVGTGVSGAVNSMLTDTLHNLLYVGGGFQSAGGIPVRSIAQWNGIGWSDIGTGGLTGGASDIIIYHNKLYVSGYSPNGLESDTVLAAWDGRNWAKIGGFNNSLLSLGEFRDTLYVGGYFTVANGDSINYLVKYHEPEVPTCFGHVTSIGTSADTLVLEDDSVIVQLADSSDIAVDSWYWDFGDGTNDTIQNPLHYYDSLGTYTIMLATNCGYMYDTTYTTVVVEEPIGVGELHSSDEDFIIYPNPTENNFTIEVQSHGKKEIEIYGLKGELVKKAKFIENSTSLKINTANWERGIYLCKLFVEDKEVQSKKVVVN